jgi:hypothetical protein
MMDEEEVAPLVLSTPPTEFEEVHNNNDHLSGSNQSERQSDRSSYIGESILYEDHLDELALEERNSYLTKLRYEISGYSVFFIGCLALSLLANGMFIDSTIS